jgi:hypothetical protein
VVGDIDNPVKVREYNIDPERIFFLYGFISRINEYKTINRVFKGIRKTRLVENLILVLGWSINTEITRRFGRENRRPARGYDH